MKIGKREIGNGAPAYLIAEMSANHAGELTLAKEIIHAAKEAGADCIKVQTYTPDTLTIDSDQPYFHIKDGTWGGTNLYQLYQKAYMPWEWQGELRKEAKKVGIDFFSTPFDKSAVDFLEEIGVEFYKIASFELIDLPLVGYIASKGKPIIMSTGMATLSEIDEAVSTIRNCGNENLALLRCASAYPAITDEMNLRTMQNMAETFQVPVGLSDHSMGAVGAVTAVALGASIIEKHFCIDRSIENPQNMAETFQVPVGLSDHSMGAVGAVTAVALGASIIEKHFCIDRSIENPDASFSMNRKEYSQMVKDIRQAERAIGRVRYGMTEQEKNSKLFRRSIFCVRDIKKGERITEENVRVIRPGNGMAPKFYPEILGQRALMDIERGTPLHSDMIGRYDNDERIL